MRTGWWLEDDRALADLYPESLFDLAAAAQEMGVEYSDAEAGAILIRILSRLGVSDAPSAGMELRLEIKRLIPAELTALAEGHAVSDDV